MLKDRNLRFVFPTKAGVLDENDENDEMLRLRQRAEQVTGNTICEASDSRDSRDPMHPVAPTSTSAYTPPMAEPDLPVAISNLLPRARTALYTGHSAAPGRSTRDVRKRHHDDAEDQSSSPPTVLVASEAASTTANSRIGPPARATKPRTSTRNTTASTSDVARRSAKRRRTLVCQDGNDGYCSSCGGNGDLICCDGCTRSLHLCCIDPPLYEDAILQQWFCNPCRSKQQAPSVFQGPFRELLALLEHKCSSAFTLPKETREKFDNVRTGPNGEYDESKPPPPRTKNKKTDEEIMLESHRLRDPSHDDRAILCHACLSPGTNSRPIVPCPDCGLYWHIDCVDPPMPHVPVALRDWRCPAHVDGHIGKLPGTFAPAHRHRQIKGVPVMTPVFSRVNASNGFIEVDWDHADDKPDMPPVQDHSGWRSVAQFGRTINLSGPGIQKDFLSRLDAPVPRMADLTLDADMPLPRLRRDRKGKVIDPLLPTPATFAPSQSVAHLRRDVLERQQAAYTLTQFGGRNSSSMTSLIDTLLTQAGPALSALLVCSAGGRRTETVGAAGLHEMTKVVEILIALRSSLLERGTER